MRIEICAGALSSATVMDYQSDMRSFLSDQESLIASFKAVSGSTVSLSGGVGALQGALDDIWSRITDEEKSLSDARAAQSSMNDFLDLSQRVDRQVADAVNRNKEEFYGKYPELRPTSSDVEKKAWYEEAWDWLCGVGEAIGEGVSEIAGAIEDTLRKAWDELPQFYEEHWYEIINWGVTILCAIGSIVAVALIPVTGGASILLVAGVSAISSAIVAATRSITTQQRDKGSVDWGEVGKEAATAALIGAVTGAIGAGVGGAITSGLSNTALGASLLSSSSTAVRVLTGTAIGSASEVASGMLTRGVAEATESYLETGTVDYEEVWDAATDPQQMALDATIGGATGGFSAGRAPEPAQPKYGSVHDEGFPQESIQAVNDYVGPNHYADINKSYFDSSVELSTQNQRIDQTLTKTLDASSIPEPLTTYRGSGLDELGGLGDLAVKYKNDPAGLRQALEGQTYTKYGYMSTGDQGLAKSYMKDLNVTIDVPGGSKGLDVSISSAGKSEYLFPANSELEIVSAEWRGEKLYVNAKLNPTSTNNIPNDVVSPAKTTLSQGTEVNFWQQSENKVDAFLGDNYHKQVSINSSDLSAGKYGGKGTIRIDNLRGDIAGKPQDLTNMDNFSRMEHFDVGETKNYSIEKSYGRSNLKKNIITQASERNEVLTQAGATVNQTYYVDTVGHNVTIGQWERLYNSLIAELPQNVDIFPMWK